MGSTWRRRPGQPWPASPLRLDGRGHLALDVVVLDVTSAAALRLGARGHLGRDVVALDVASAAALRLGAPRTRRAVVEAKA